MIRPSTPRLLALLHPVFLAALVAWPAACGRTPAAGVAEARAGSPGSAHAGPAAAANPATPAADDARLAGSWRFERDGWIYAHLEGTPERIGFQHGYLLSAETADLLRVMAAFLRHETKRDWSFYQDAAEQMLWPKLDPEYQEELAGIVAGLGARGVKADLWDVVALNGMEELAYYYVPWLDAREERTARKNPGSCSAFVATGSYTKDRRIVMGHNAWTNYPVGARWNIVFDVAPAKGHRFIMDGLPGVIVSDDDFGVNAAGLMVTETTITQFHGFDPDGVPEFMRARKALQYAGSIDEFVKIMLEGNNGGYANDWLVGDNERGEIALFELGLKEHSLRRTTDGYYVGSNFPVDPKLIAAETTFDVRRMDSSPNARRTRWEQLMAQHKGQIDLELAKAFESDAHDAFENRPGPNERSLCGLVDVSPRGLPEWDWTPFYPGGTVQAKVTTGALTKELRFQAAMGHPCAPGFKAAEFLAAHPEYAWTRDLLIDMPTRPWTEFRAGMRGN